MTLFHFSFFVSCFISKALSLVLPSKTRITIASPDVGFLPAGFYQVDLVVVPMWGLYANMIAQLLSQLLSHIIIYYHRKIVRHAGRARKALKKTASAFLALAADTDYDENFADENDTATTRSSEKQSAIRTRLCQHAFQRPHRIDQPCGDGVSQSEASKLVVRDFVNPVIIVTAAAVFVLIIAGCALPSFSVEVFGILGIVVESGLGGSEARSEHSIFSIAGLLIDQAKLLKGAGNYIGLGTLTVLLVTTVLWIPIMQTMILCYQWFASLTKSSLVTMTSFVEVVQAW